MSDTKFLGIDLGTSNSAVAVFKGSACVSVLNGLGKINTPSIVRVSETGITVGEKAKRWLSKDSKNTFKEFKRLMGTEANLHDGYGRAWTADELSAEVLKNLREQAEQTEECIFDKVIITVPALFELPQSKATSNAARLAGFDKVELLPEPVASGLACGWGKEDTNSVWLVYDLGGGTFDVSLLESRDGLLRVVAHDGDNFLGGRDIDIAIVEWIKTVIVDEFDIEWSDSIEGHNSFIRYLESQAEKAKIRLSDISKTEIVLDAEYGDEYIEIDIPFSQEKLADLAGSLIQKSVDICLRLLKNQGLDKSQLARAVLVGGPAHMLIIKQAINEQLAPLADSEYDPMSLVSRGAAIFSATMGLACSAEPTAGSTTKEPQVWLQYPSVCSELNPAVMGRIIDANFNPDTLQLLSLDTSWKSLPVKLDDTGIFLIDVNIRSGQKNTFKLVAIDTNGSQIPVAHSDISIVHGITMTDPPLARSIGVALADGWVKTFIDRGTPLPAKRTFTQSTVQALAPGTDDSLVIPIVQGERRKARFCRSVGSLVINADELTKPLPTGTNVEITIEVDRGGDLKAQAYLPEQKKLIEGVAQLMIANQSVEALTSMLNTLNTRVNKLSQQAFRERDMSLVDSCEPLLIELQSMQKTLSGDQEIQQDTCQRLARNLQDLEAQVEQIESQGQLQELIDECQDKYFHAAGRVEEYGDEMDKRSLEECNKQLATAIEFSRQSEIERLIERLESISGSAYRKNPYYIVDRFNYWASFISSATNPKRANILVEKGKKLIEQESYPALKPIVDEIYNLIPQQVRASENSYDSGVY